MADSDTQVAIKKVLQTYKSGLVLPELNINLSDWRPAFEELQLEVTRLRAEVKKLKAKIEPKG